MTKITKDHQTSPKVTGNKACGENRSKIGMKIGPLFDFGKGTDHIEL